MFLPFSFNTASTNLIRTTYPARTRMARMLATVVLMANAASVVHAQSNFEEEFDNQDKAWQEIAFQLPAAPRAENLLPFYVSATATQSFAIDAKSVAVGTDGVVRYTLVTTSASGAKNVSYEGIRCQLLQKKLYAFGHADGSWARSRRDQWEPISGNAANRHHAALAEDYFCQGGTIAGNAEAIVDRLRYTKVFTRQ